LEPTSTKSTNFIPHLSGLLAVHWIDQHLGFIINIFIDCDRFFSNGTYVILPSFTLRCF